MSWLKRAGRVFRQRRIEDELDEELASHLAEAVERGRTPEEARRALGSPLRHREQSRDFKLLPWLDGLVRDVVFGCRQLRKRPGASAAAILSLGLAIGATTAVFRLVDAVLLRRLPVAEPERLFYLAENYVDRDGKPDWRDDYDYPTFRRYRALAANSADLLLVGTAGRQDAILAPGGEPEKVARQYVSGNVFGIFGLRPALGRLLLPEDDLHPGAQPVAVLSYAFWKRRFDGDPSVLGRVLRVGRDRLEVVGVAPKEFTGTEPGEVTDIFVPSMMNADALDSPGWSWFRIWLRPKPGWTAEQARQILAADFDRAHAEQSRKMDADTPRAVIDRYLAEKLYLRPAERGASTLQREYQRPLLVLGVLVALVLLVACVNVGNLLSAQAAARSREMALRISIGAGRARLAQLALVESALLAIAGSAAGALFAAWAAPLVVSMLRMPEDPVRLAFTTGWREIAFGAALAAVVTALFGMAPALRASRVEPLNALKGGDPRARTRSLYTMLAAQIAFCMVVQLVAGLFVASFRRLATRPLGFSYDRVLVMDIGARSQRDPSAWNEIADRLRAQGGVESVTIAGWAPLSMNRWSVGFRTPEHAIEARPPYCLDVAPGFFATLGIGLLDGRDFRTGDAPPQLKGDDRVAGVGIVNEAFARVYFDGQNPVGRWVDMHQAKDAYAPMQIVGYVRDAAYASVREPMRPTVYIPLRPRNESAFLVRTAGDPRAFAGTLRRAVAAAGPGFRAAGVQPALNFPRWQMLRERLLAALSAFFAMVALALAAVGLYGTMNYAVTGEVREIGIRMALGARASHVARRVARAPSLAVGAGLALGIAGGVAGGRAAEALLFEIHATDGDAVALPAALLLGAALLAALPPVLRAARIDPARTLRSE